MGFGVWVVGFGSWVLGGVKVGGWDQGLEMRAQGSGFRGEG